VLAAVPDAWDEIPPVSCCVCVHSGTNITWTRRSFGSSLAFLSF
jgi:hypothetical protein